MGKLNSCMSKDDGEFGLDMLRSSFNRSQNVGAVKSCTVSPISSPFESDHSHKARCDLITKSAVSETAASGQIAKRALLSNR